MAKPSDLLVWLDMEMTGLDPVVCVPIEVALIVTTADLAEIETFHEVIHQPESAFASMSDFVRDMHTRNGLLERVRVSDRQLGDVDQELAKIVSKHCPGRSAVLSGNSIHQDRKFIARYFPVLEEQLHYRMVDVSTMKELVRRWYGDSALYTKPESDHTALADVRESIAELAFYRQRFFSVAPKTD